MWLSGYVAMWPSGPCAPQHSDCQPCTRLLLMIVWDVVHVSAVLIWSRNKFNYLDESETQLGVS